LPVSEAGLLENSLEDKGIGWWLRLWFWFSIDELLFLFINKLGKELIFFRIRDSVRILKHLYGLLEGLKLYTIFDLLLNPSIIEHFYSSSSSNLERIEKLSVCRHVYFTCINQRIDSFHKIFF